MVSSHTTTNTTTLINTRGMSRSTGMSIDKIDHINQSLKDILTTPTGSRVMRRNYGSLLPYLIDAPMTARLVMQLRASVIHAIMRWEHRVTPTRIELMTDSTASQGNATLLIEYQFNVSKQVARTYLSLGGAM